MSIELQVLGWAVMLAVLQLVGTAALANVTTSSYWLAGPRDEPRAFPKITGRLFRAFNNHVEGLVLFIGAVVLVELGQASTPATETAAIIYLIARIAYVPAYGFGIRYLRSAIWAVGFGATVFMVTSTLF